MHITKEQAAYLIEHFRNVSKNKENGQYCFTEVALTIQKCVKKPPIPEISIRHDGDCVTTIRMANEADWGKDIIQLVVENPESGTQDEHFYSPSEFANLLVIANIFMQRFDEQ